MLKISIYAKTDVGLIREKNEDSFCVVRHFKKMPAVAEEYSGDRRGESMVAVFDGIGGEACGEMAAFIASKTAARFNGHLPAGDWNCLLQEINFRICDFAEHFDCNTGCTAAMLHYKDGFVNLCNLGDSRIYMYRGGKLTQLSKDHTELQRALDMNLPDFNVEKSGLKKGKLTKYLGVRIDRLNPYTVKNIPVLADDLFLLCSDGLTDMLTDGEICETIASSTDVKSSADALVKRALENGGLDNVTVVIVKAYEKATLWDKLKKKLTP